MNNSLFFTIKLWVITAFLAPTLNWSFYCSRNIIAGTSNEYLQDLPEVILIQSIITIPVCLISFGVNRILFKEIKNDNSLRQFLSGFSILLIALPWVTIMTLSGDSDIVYIIVSYILIAGSIVWFLKIEREVQPIRMLYPQILDEEI